MTALNVNTTTKTPKSTDHEAGAFFMQRKGVLMKILIIGLAVAVAVALASATVALIKAKPYMKDLMEGE